MDQRGIDLLGLPPLRGNPFDMRPIESGRAEDIVGRDLLLAKWREHIISKSPRMAILVGERGSGRTSLIRALASQTRKSYIGQTWPDGNPVNSVIHELTIHFGDFNPPKTTQLMIDRLVKNLDQDPDSLPLIAFDYPPEVEVSSFVELISPVLQRLRAFIVVVLTPSQLSNMSEETLEMFDRPEFLDGLTTAQIQQLSDKLVSRRAKERWKIDQRLLEAIRDITGGTPRDVIRLLRDLTDERRDVGSHGTLERVMGWNEIGDPSGSIRETTVEKNLDQAEETPEFQYATESTSENLQTHQLEEELETEISPKDEFPEWDIDDNQEVYDDQEFSEEISDDPDDLWEEEDHQNEQKQENPEPSEKKGTLEDFVYEPGTEPPMLETGFGFNRLAARSRNAPPKPTTSDGTEIIDASINRDPRLSESEPPSSLEPDEPTYKKTIEDSSAPIDTAIRSNSESGVMSTESAYWSVEESSQSTLPDLSGNETTEPPKTVFGIEEAPAEEIFFEEEIPEPTPPLPTPKISISPKWDVDNPLDESKLASLNEAEVMILEASSEREISPSDAELQARLEVGRPRLSQIYNELLRTGLLSVRKQGRKRLFKISEAAAGHFGGV
tara:strand:+ start:7217 stop:9052 length:1836 start_codon:yes stop_codon:yes gene_type:complete